MQRNRGMKKLSMRNYMGQNHRQNCNENENIVAREGSQGKNIEELQKMLIMIAEDYETIPVVNITANYDDMTKRAILELQKRMGIQENGMVDRALWNRIYMLSHQKRNIAVARVSRQEEDSMDESSNVLQEGSSGKFVYDLQKYLNTVAEKYPIISKLSVDGKFGPKTKAAVLAFQKLFHLEEDGIVGQITWDTLYSISLGKQPPTIFD